VIREILESIEEPETDSLEKEARKYKTAEEFVKNISDNKNLDSIASYKKVDNINSFLSNRNFKDVMWKEDLDLAKGFVRGDSQMSNGKEIKIKKLTNSSQLPAIVIDDFNKVIEGNHRWLAAKLAGLKDIKTVTKAQLIDIYNKATEDIDKKEAKDVR